MIAAGWSLLLVAVFYFVIDISGATRWAFPFVVIGVNALTIYVLQEFVNFPEMSKYLFGGVAMLTGAAAAVVLAIGATALRWLLLRYLYRNGTFLQSVEEFQNAELHHHLQHVAAGLSVRSKVGVA